MTARPYLDCPDLRVLIEWRVARAYEAMADAGAELPTRSNPYDDTEHAALYWYTVCWATIAGDLP